MRTRVVVVLALVALLIVTVMLGITVIPGITVNPGSSARPSSSQLTTDELADTLGVHWWIFNVPADIHVDDTVSIQWFSPSGCYSGTGIGVLNPGEQVKIFCWPAGDGTRIRLVAAKGVAESWNTNMLLADRTVHGVPNGTVVSEGDFLLKAKARGPWENVAMDPKNALKPDELGLKLTIARKSVATAH